MAYDNKNHYPKKATTPKRMSIGRKTSDQPTGTDDVKKCLDALKSVKDDMKTLNVERERLYRAYKTQKYGNELKGRSEIVASDVANAVESFMPDFMEVFYGGQNVVEIRPQGIGDEDKARLMQEKINFDFQKGLNGYVILHNWFKDALIYKMGVIKWCWKKEEKYEYKEYHDIDQTNFILLQADPNFTVEEVEEEIVQMGGMDMLGMMTPPVISYSVKGRVKTEVSKPLVENVPPEEFLFDIRMKDRKDGFIAHKRCKRKDDIIKEYSMKPEDFASETEKFDDPLYVARFDDLGGVSFFTPDKNYEDKDKRSGNYYVYECYYPGSDKIITIFGETKLREEENTYGVPPFVMLSPNIEPHRMIGTSPIEIAEMYQKVHTALTRYIMDNIAFQSNGMNVVNPFRINMDDLTNGNCPGGKVRTKYDIDPSSAIFPVPITPLAPQVFQYREFSEGQKENAIGVTRYNQGLDAKSLNRTATGISQIMSAAQKRVRFIARTFAETGVRQLFEDMVNLNLKFFDKETSVKINDEWLTITPEDINGNFDVLIDVGVGTGSTEVKVNQMMQMMQNYAMIAQIAGPMVSQIFTIENIKNIIKEIWQAWGYKDTSKFVAPDMQEGMMNGGGIPPQVTGTGIEGTPGKSVVDPSALGGVLPGVGGNGEAQGMGYPPY